MTKKTTTETQKLETKERKKPYVRPHLVEYGSAAKLTASGGSTVMADGLGTFMAG